MVPIVIEEAKIESKDEIKELLKLPSKFKAESGADKNTCLEGIYLRIDNNETGRCIARAKVVRPDFTQNIIGHWTQKKVVMNIVSYDNYDEPLEL
jgi:hypothetical protein